MQGESFAHIARCNGVRAIGRARRKAMGLWLGRRKYRARREVARAMEQGIVEPYLARWAAAAVPGAPAVSAR